MFTERNVPLTCLLLCGPISQVIGYVPLAHSPSSVQFVDVAIFQLWPTLQFVLLAPISLYGLPIWFIYLPIYLFHSVVTVRNLPFLNGSGEFPQETQASLVRVSAHRWMILEGKREVTTGLAVWGCKACNMLVARVTTRLPRRCIIKPKRECDGEERNWSSRLIHFSSEVICATPYKK